MIRRFAALTFLALPMILSACLSGGGGDSGSSESSYSLSIIALPTNIVADGSSSATIKVSVSDGNGNAVANQSVTFSSTRGTLSTTSMNTNAGGSAQVTLRSSTSTGTATVTAKAGGASNSAQVKFTAGPPAQITDIASNPASPLPGSTASLEARIRDTNGNPVSGIQVTFTLVQNQSGSSFTSAQDTSNNNGLASVDYTVGPDSGADILRISIEDSDIEEQLVLAIGPQAQITDIASNPASPSPGSTALLQAYIRDGNGNPVSGIQVTFTLVQNQSGSSFTSAQATTDSTGLAVVSYVAGPNSGTDILRITAEGVAAEAQLILNITPGNISPAIIELSADPESLRVEGSTSALVTVIVRNSQGQGLPNIQVDLSSTLGSLLRSGTHRAACFTDKAGQAIFTLQAGTVSGKANLTARAGQISNSLIVDILPGSPAAIGNLSSSPASPGSNEEVILQARVTDQYGNPVPEVDVFFLLIQNQSGASFTSGQSTTDAGGWAMLNYTTGPNVGADVFRVVTDSLASEENLQLMLTPETQTISSIELTIKGDVSLPADGSSSTALEAKVLDINEAPIPGVSVNFNQSMGTLTATTAVTNANGVARVVLIAGTAAGEVTITASTGVFLDSAKVYFVSTISEIGSIDLTVTGDTTLPADGSSSTVFEVTVLDASGDPLQGVSVNLSTDLGRLSSDLVVTNTQGKAQASLMATAFHGLARITAEADGITDSDYVTFEEIQEYNVGSLSLTVLGDASILADGKSTAILEATVTNTGGQPLSGTVVYFQTTLGSVTTSYVVTNTEGKAQITLRSGTTGGQALVQAVSGAAIDTAYVTFLEAHAISVYCVDDGGNILETPTVYGDGTSSVWVQALVQDSFALPLPNVMVTFSSNDFSLGTVSPGQATTNDDGIAQTSLKGASGGVGMVKVTGEIGSVSDSVYISVTAPPAR